MWPQEFLSIAHRNAKRYGHFGRQFDSSIQNYIVLEYCLASTVLFSFPKLAENVCPHKNLHTHIYVSFIHQFQNFGAIKCPLVSEWIKKTVVLPDGGILFSTAKSYQAIEHMQEP